jgi:hypothetical protein
MLSSLIFNISPDHICGYLVPYTSGKVTITPQLPRPKLFSQLSKLFKHLSCRYTLHYLYHIRRRIFRWHLYKYVYMVFHYLHGIYPKSIFICYLLKHLFRVLSNLSYQDVLPILRYPDQMVLDVKNCVFCPSNPHASFIHGKALSRQTLLPRLTVSRFPPASKLAGIQRSSL